MNEQNEVEVAKKETDDSLVKKAQPYVDKFRRLLISVVYVVSIGMGIAIGWKFGLGDWSGGLLLGGLGFSTFGALIVVIGAVPKKSTAIEMSKTKWDGNPHLLGELLKNRLAAQFGIYFILLGFLLRATELALQVFI